MYLLSQHHLKVKLSGIHSLCSVMLLSFYPKRLFPPHEIFSGCFFKEVLLILHVWKNMQVGNAGKNLISRKNSFVFSLLPV